MAKTNARKTKNSQGIREGRDDDLTDQETNSNSNQPVQDGLSGNENQGENANHNPFAVLGEEVTSTPPVQLNLNMPELPATPVTPTQNTRGTGQEVPVTGSNPVNQRLNFEAQGHESRLDPRYNSSPHQQYPITGYPPNYPPYYPPYHNYGHPPPFYGGYPPMAPYNGHMGNMWPAYGDQGRMHTSVPHIRDLRTPTRQVEENRVVNDSRTINLPGIFTPNPAMESNNNRVEVVNGESEVETREEQVPRSTNASEISDNLSHLPPHLRKGLRSLTPSSVSNKSKGRTSRPSVLIPNHNSVHDPNLVQYLSAQGREKLILDAIKDTKSNRPILKSTTTKAIHSFIEGWAEYKSRMDAHGVVAVLQDCVQIDVHSHLAKTHRISIKDTGRLEEILQVIAKQHASSQKAAARDQLSSFPWPEHVVDLAKTINEVTSKIEDITRDVTYSEQEEKAVCELLIRRFPRIFFDKGYNYAFLAHKLWTVREVVSYLRNIPNTVLDTAMISKWSEERNHRGRTQQQGRVFRQDGYNRNHYASKDNGYNRNNQASKDNKPIGNYPNKTTNDQRVPRQHYQNNGRPNTYPPRPYKSKYPANSPIKGELQARQAEVIEKTDDMASDHNGHCSEESSSLVMDDISSVDMVEGRVEANQIQAGSQDDYDLYYEDDNLLYQDEGPHSYGSAARARCSHIINTDINSISAAMQLPGQSTWISTTAELDSGATDTLAPAHLFKKLDGLQPSPLTSVRTAGGKMYKIIGQLRLNLKLRRTGSKAKPTILADATIHIVDSMNWKDVLIGADILSKLKLMPVQHLERLEGKRIYLKPLVPATSRRVIAYASQVISQQAPLQVKIQPDRLPKPPVLPIDGLQEHHDHSTCKCGDCIIIQELLQDGIQGYAENIDALGYSDVDAVRVNLKSQMVKGMNENILSAQQFQEYTQLMEDFIEVFGTKDSVTQMSLLPPMRVFLKPGAEPFVDSPRRMDQIRFQALRKKLEDLLRIGMIVRQDDPVFGSVVFLVPKKNGTYRMVIDLRKLNSLCLDTALILPDLDMQLGFLPPKARFFASFDCLSGFDLLRTDERDTHMFGIVTPLGNFRLCGAPMGFKNTPVVYEQRLLTYILGWKGEDLEDSGRAGIFCRRSAGALLWLDDILVYAEHWHDFLRVLTTLFLNLRKYKVRLNATKCEIIKQKLVWCGREISLDGYRYCRSHYEKILALQQPNNLRELEQVVYIMNWLAPAIPNHARSRSHFQDLATKIRADNKIVDKKIRKSDSKLSIYPYWTPIDQEMWTQLKTLLQFTADHWLARYDPSRRVLVYTDASNKYWGMVLVQEDSKGHPLPMQFLSGKFTGSQTRWSINDKEAFPIVFAIKRFHYMTCNSVAEFVIRTDHKNLTYLTDVHKKLGTMLPTARLYRWSLIIQESGSKLEFIAGELNQMADLLSRWSYPDLARALHVQAVRKPSNYHLSLAPGWSAAEDKMLRLLLQRYGIGNWTKIKSSHFLPGKSISQLVARTLRLIGQQQVSEFRGLCIDPLILRQHVSKKQGLRRGGILIHQGDRLPRSTILTQLERNRVIFRRHLNLHVEILPLKQSEISGQYFSHCPPSGIIRYLKVLHAARAYLEEKEKRLQLLLFATPTDKTLARARLASWTRFSDCLHTIREGVFLSRVLLTARPRQTRRWEPLISTTPTVRSGSLDIIRLEAQQLEAQFKGQTSEARQTDRPHRAAHRRALERIQKWTQDQPLHPLTNKTASLKHSTVPIPRNPPIEEPNSEITSPSLPQKDQEWVDFALSRVSFLNPQVRQPWVPISEEEMRAEQIFEWKQMDEKTQKRYIKGPNGLLLLKDKIWVPKTLRNRIIAHNHIVNRHSSLENEFLALNPQYNLEVKDLRQTLRTFREACLHCHRRPALLRRPLYPTWHAKKPNAILRMDYLKIEGSYLLVMIDDLSRKVELVHTLHADTNTTCNSILWWKARYGLRRGVIIMTDNGSHFAGNLVKQLCNHFAYSQRFSVAYSPWSNGSVENVNSVILKILKALVSEYGVVNDNWPALLPLIQCYMNHRRNPHTRFTPNEVFMGKDKNQDDLLNKNSQCQHHSEGFPVVIDKSLRYPKDVKELEKDLASLADEIAKMANRTYDVFQKIREDQCKRYNRRWQVSSVQYQPGDFVLLSTRDIKKNRSKLKLTWIGPLLVTKTFGRNVYELTEPTGDTHRVHSCRIMMYKGGGFRMSDEVKAIYIHNRGQFYLKQVLDVTYHEGAYWVLCQWVGLEDAPGTWQLMTQILDEAPDILLRFVDKNSHKSPLLKQLFKHLSSTESKRVVGEVLHGKADCEVQKVHLQ